MTVNLERQAKHFDAHSPYVPAPHLLRGRGFDLQYILKDAEIAQLIKGTLEAQGVEVLDVGCGDGLLLDRLKRSYSTSGYGIDISHQSLTRGQAASSGSFRVSRSDARMLPFPNDSFGAVISLDVLEHVENPKIAINEMARVLKPGGRMICYAVSSENQFTWNWLLTRWTELMGLDIWAHSAHSPDLLVKPDLVLDSLLSSKLEVIKISYIHAFSTLGFDQLLLGSYWLAERLRLIGDNSPLRRVAAETMMRVFAFLTKVMRPILHRIDTPWVSRGLSNGFLILAKKTQPVD